ncbi:hypothetical protein [Sphingomonas guangdongensis]|nr:hypothetical protein [Sphingomonas guangdongensis]
MKDLSRIVRGRVVGIEYPLTCRIAPLRWIWSLTEYRLPVTYTVAVTRTLWGPPVRTTRIVQHQTAELDGCRPLGAPACEAAIPTGETLWVIRRLPNGEQRYTGGCGAAYAPYILRIARQSGK